MTHDAFRWEVTVEMPRWPRRKPIRTLRRQLQRDPRVLRYAQGWPLWLRVLREIHPHVTIEIAAPDQRGAYRQAEAIIGDALHALGLPAEASPWTLSTEWERV